MRLDRWRQRPYLGAALLGALLGLGGGLATGWPESAPVAIVEAPWSLPTADALARYRQADFLTLQQSAAWRGAAAVGPAKAAATWKLLGLVSEGGGTALVRVGATGANVQRLRAGSDLPDGGRLLDVQADRIVVENQGCRRTIRLYQAAAAAANAACDNAGPTNDPPPGKP